jgi:hypothetical protein
VEWWVVGLVDRKNEQIKLHVLPQGRLSVNRDNCMAFVLENCRPGTLVVTDSSTVYSTATLNINGMWHATCNHSVGQRVVPYLHTVSGTAVGTQAVEGMWGRLRRFLQRLEAHKVRHTQGSLQCYCNEFSFRTNTRMAGGDAAFEQVCATLRAPTMAGTGRD